jgi:hypothetical protein
LINARCSPACAAVVRADAQADAVAGLRHSAKSTRRGSDNAPKIGAPSSHVTFAPKLGRDGGKS